MEGKECEGSRERGCLTVLWEKGGWVCPGALGKVSGADRFGYIPDLVTAYT